LGIDKPHAVTLRDGQLISGTGRGVQVAEDRRGQNQRKDADARAVAPTMS